jgi:predicted amidohydrolase
VFDWQGIRVGLAVCYDLRFPELFRAAVAIGPEPPLFVVIANWPEKRSLHWLRLLQARAIENQSYVLGVNRIGTDPFYAYAGRSVLVGPAGDLLAEAGDAEQALSAHLDLEHLRRYRAGLPFLRDFDPDPFRKAWSRNVTPAD